MPDRDAFLRSIAENFREISPRLIYADWLEERGECDEATRQRELFPRIAALVKEADRLWADYYIERPPTRQHRARFVSPKWCLVFSTDAIPEGAEYDDVRVNACAYCFVALTDYEVKDLGRVRLGDIHMPKSWKRPAKHSRGSIFSENFGGCLRVHGVKYLTGAH